MRGGVLLQHTISCVGGSLAGSRFDCFMKRTILFARPHLVACRLLVVLFTWVGMPFADAERLNWYSTLNSTNLASDGSLMNGAFRFELGVFADGFVPTAVNTPQWSAKWHSAQRVSYNPTNRWFSSLFVVDENPAPFLVGAKAYVWGFRGDEVSGEWILFRKGTWNWPAPNPFNPNVVSWNAKDADTVVLGSVNASGSPHLMRSAAVAASLPPSTYWDDWVAEELAGVALNGPSDDPDHDGVVNILEYVFGTAPNLAGSAAAVTGEWVFAGGASWFQIRIPRRRDHPAELVVEISTDLRTWNSGPTLTQVVEDGPRHLVVRDLGSSTTGGPRFMRLRAAPAAP